MPIMYKLVNEDMTSRGGMKWEIGKKNTASGPGTKLCTSGVLHCYSDPNLAVLFAPLHLDVDKPLRLLEIKTTKVLDSDGLKYATKSQTPTKEITLPVFTKEQRVAFALKCALLVFKESWFVTFAEKWLSGEDRSESAARSAVWSAARSAESAARSAARSAAESAARSAAESADHFASIAQWCLDNI